MTAREISLLPEICCSVDLVWKVAKANLGLVPTHGPYPHDFTREEVRAIMKGIKERRAANAAKLVEYRTQQQKLAAERRAAEKDKKSKKSNKPPLVASMLRSPKAKSTPKSTPKPAIKQYGDDEEEE